MLTARQVLVVSGQNSNSLHANALLQQFPARPLSLQSVIAAYEKQRVAVLVSLISTKVLSLPNIRTMEDLLEAARGAAGQVDGAEVLALSSRLREHGLSLRLLDKGLRRAAIIGTVPSLVNVPTVPINEGNLVHVLDVKTGIVEAGGGIGAFGSVLLAVGLVSGPIGWAALTGAGLAALGAGAVFGVGVYDIWKGDPKPRPTSDSNDSTSTPNDLGPEGPTGETIDLPNAVSLGSPADDLNVDGILQQLGDFAVDFSVDMVLSDLPVGFDPATGSGLPGFGSGDGGGSNSGDGDGGGINPFG